MNYRCWIWERQRWQRLWAGAWKDCQPSDSARWWQPRIVVGGQLLFALLCGSGCLGCKLRCFESCFASDEVVASFAADDQFCLISVCGLGQALFSNGQCLDRYLWASNQFLTRYIISLHSFAIFFSLCLLLSCFINIYSFCQ